MYTVPGPAPQGGGPLPAQFRQAQLVGSPGAVPTVAAEPLLLPHHPSTFLGPVYANTKPNLNKSHEYVYTHAHTADRRERKATGMRRGSARPCPDCWPPA